MQPVDYLVVGGGLAGTLLAQALLQRGASCKIFAGDSGRAASRVAAGVLNPVTGRRLAAAWRVEEQLLLARKTYGFIEALTGRSFFRPVPLQRFFLRDSEQEFHQRRRQDPRYRSLLSPAYAAGTLLAGMVARPLFRDERGSFGICGAGHLDIVVFLEAMEAHLGSIGVWVPEPLSYSRLSLQNGSVGYDRRFIARSVIFCEGIDALENPWFDWLPFHPVKGESLLFESHTLSLPPAIFHHHKWIIPEGPNLFRLGSTYDRGILQPSGPTRLHPDAFLPSTAGSLELLAALGRMLEEPVQPKIIERRAGVRPATRDRLPYVGPHPQINPLHILNGLGSKGALLAPWLAGLLADFLTLGSPLPSQFLPARCYRRK